MSNAYLTMIIMLCYQCKWPWHKLFVFCFLLFFCFVFCFCLFFDFCVWVCCFFHFCN